MPDMKIGEVGENYSNASFTFQHNPETLDIPANPNKKFKSLPMGKRHVATDYGGTEPKSIVLRGEFTGTNARSNYQDLVFHLNDDNLKKFFIADDRFYYVLGQRVKETLEGGRPTFVPYVGGLWTPIPYAYSNTEQSYTISLSDGSAYTLNDSTTGSTGSFDNSGNAPSFVDITVENTGTQNITQVEVGDGSLSSGNVSGNHVTTWTGTLQPGETLTIPAIKYANIGDGPGGRYTKYLYAEIGGSEAGDVTVTNSFDGLTQVNADTTNQDFSIQLTGNDGADVTINWRDAYRS